jgi:protein-L-isoaspartate(D-aspartate) O-methyltransferase
VPFDGIAVAAAAPVVPPALYAQLAEGGRLVLPRGSRWSQELVLVVRGPDGPAERASIPCRFVPLLGDEGFGDV